MKKKIISLAVAAALALSMSTTAFAGEKKIEASTGEASFSVNGTYQASSSTPIYKVDIEWGSMEFTYSEASKGTWNPETHKYEGGTTTAGWTCATDANKITIINHSNAMVHTSLKFTPKDNDIEMKFMDENNIAVNGSTMNSADNNLGENGAGKEVTSVYYATITKGSISETGEIGTITITIS